MKALWCLRALLRSQAWSAHRKKLLKVTMKKAAAAAASPRKASRTCIGWCQASALLLVGLLMLHRPLEEQQLGMTSRYEKEDDLERD